MKNILTFLFLICASVTYAQKIRLKVEDQKDTTVFLIKYFGSRLNYADTAQMKNGVVVFDGKKQKPGIVGLLLPGQKYFEFVYNNEEVQLETKGPDFMSNMKIIKSEENKIFIPYVKFISGKKGDANKLAEQRAKLKDTDEEYAKLSASIDAINKEVDDYQKELVALHGEKLVGKIVKMSMDVTVPETPKNEQGEIIDSNFRYKYYFEHYWDNVDFKTDALVNNPIFHNKLEFYFGKNMMIQHWDTIIKYAFKFCDGLDSKSKMFEYSVGWIATTFGKSQIMGMDKVYLYMLNRYFCTTDPATGKSPATWVAEDKFEELCKDLKWKLNLVVGAKPYNLILRDTSDTKWLDFYSLKSEYTILYFWDPECGHCKKVTPKLVKLYNQKLKYRDIEVFAVGKGIGKDFESWKKYIRENNLNFINVAVTNSIYEIAKATPEKLVPVNAGDKGKPTTLESLNFQTTYDLYSTPRIFVLDKDKKIIAKNLSVSQVEDLLDNLQGYRGVEKILKPENVDDESQESLDENLSNAEIQEIESKEKELSEELQSIINSQLKTENYISPNVKLDVNARTENVYIDGKKETKIHLEYLYEVVKLNAENKTDDFSPGGYDLKNSNAAMFLMNFVNKTLSEKLNTYLKNGTEVLVKIKGYTDATGIKDGLVYKGEFGDFKNESYFFNSDIMSFSKVKGGAIKNNNELGFLRTMAVQNYMQNNIEILKKCKTTFENEVIVSEGIGSSYRKISVEIIINKNGGSKTESKEITEVSSMNKTNYEDLYLNCKKGVFMIEILNEENGLVGKSQGSGFIVSSDGVAISNFHVFENGFLNSARIHLDDGSITTIESVLEQNPEKDYIVFKLKNNQKEGFDKLRIATQMPKIASEVFTIGNPEGLEKSYSKGEVSAYRMNYNFIQMTTPINHGSSGGPLFNNKGEVVGITSGTFKELSYVYDLDGKIIGVTENGGQGSMYKAINILNLGFEKYVK